MRTASLLLAFTISFGFVVGCASTDEQRTPGERGATTSDGELLTLESGDGGPVWRDWKPTDRTQTAPGRLVESVRAFDYWETRRRGVIDQVWRAVFPILDGVRARSESEAKGRAVQALLEALEPDQNQEAARTRMDLTFVVGTREENPFEGFACRLYRRLPEPGVSPRVTALFLRHPEEAKAPSEIWIWANPSFRDAPAFTVVLRRKSGGWGRDVREGLSYPKMAKRPELGASRAGRLEARILRKRIWRQFAGNRYSRASVRERKDARELPDDIRRALGLDVRSRRVGQVLSNTRFPPAADLDGL